MGDPWVRKEVIERFEQKCVQTLPSGCIIWCGSINENGYGTLTADGKRYKAHRFSWAIRHGYLPSPSFLLHSCDVPCCVNADHLSVGTQSQNIRDSWNRGRRSNTRFARGEDQGASKLTAADVRDIRRLCGELPKTEVARRFGVTRSNVSSIFHRKSWAHVK